MLRAGGSALLLALLFWFVPWKDVADGFARVPLTLFLVVWLLFLAGHVAASAKWWTLLDRAFAFPLALRAHFAGLAANLCLPGVAGGDAVRAGLAHTAMRDGPRLAAGAVADRLIDMLALACLALVGVLMLRESGSGATIAIQAVGLTLAILAAVVFALPWLVERFWTLFPALPGRDFAARTATAFKALGRRPGLLLLTFGASMAIQGLFILLAVQLAEAVGVDLPLGAWVFAWPMAKIVAVLPISLGGLGLREASLAALLTPFGAEAAQVVAAGLVWQAVLFLTGALGASVLLISGIGLKAAPSNNNSD